MPDFQLIRKVFGYPDSLYNCSSKTKDEWEREGIRWPTLGMFLAILGTAYICLYIPSFYAILKMKLTNHSCYRIMFVLIITDILNIISSSWLNAYMAVIGGVFCTNPFWSYLNGMFTIFIWNFACFLYVLLAINRLCVMTGFQKINWIFRSYGGYILWLGPALIYAFYCGVFNKPFPFNSKVFAAITSPFIEDIKVEEALYLNPTHKMNNLGTAVLLTIIYGSIWCLVVSRKDFRVSRDEMRLLLQSIFITLPIFLAAVVYVYILFFSSGNMFLCLFGYFSWQTCAGISSIVYLTINRSIRSFYFKKNNQKENTTDNELKRSSKLTLQDPTIRIEAIA